MSLDLPRGPGSDEQLEKIHYDMIIKNGIRSTSEGFCQYYDYGIIEKLKPDFKGEESVSGPFLLEMIPPPSPAIQYIQVHRLSGNENLSHLLLAYHHYGAAKAVIFVNTSDEFQLHQNLLNTLPATSEEYSKQLSMLIPKRAGTDLVVNIRRFPSLRCKIHSASVDAFNLELTGLGMAIAPHHPVPAETGHDEKPPEELDSLIDEMKVCLTQKPKSFQGAMRIFQQLENKKKFLKFLRSVTVSPVIWHLLNPSRFGGMFKLDFPFYVVVAYRLLNKHKVYDLRRETIGSFCKICVEGLYALPPEVLQETLEGFINRGSFDAKFSTEEISIFETLGNGFSKLCEIWLKEKHDKCWGVAFLCMSLSMKMFVAAERPVLAEKQWELHILSNHQKLSWGPNTFCEIKRGLECMRVLRISSGMVFNPRNFSDLLNRQPIISFSCLNELVKILQKFSIDSWKAAFLSFLEDMQKKYKGHIFKRTNNYSGVSKQDGMFSAFEEGWMFMLTVVEFLRIKKWLDEDVKFQTECYSWFYMLLHIIDFNSNECLECVNLVVSTPKDPAFNWNKEMNSRFRECCHRLSVEVFQLLYGATKFWQLDILDIYLRSFKPQVDIVICSTQWQKLLQDVSQCPLRHSLTLLNLLMNVGNKYADSGRANEFIPDLLTIDAPHLFLHTHSSAKRSKGLDREFSQGLATFIKKYSLRKYLLQDVSRIMEKLPFKEHFFWSLIIAVILEEAFIEINSSDLCNVLNILEVTFQLVHHFMNRREYVSVKARCVFGALRFICSRINVSDKSLDWFLHSKDLLVGVCNCFKPFCQRIDHSGRDLSAVVTEFSKSTSSIEVECFLNFCLRLQTNLKKWKEKVKMNDVSPHDIQNLNIIHEDFGCICEIMYIPEACIETFEVQQLLHNCNNIKSKLQDHLIIFVPGMRWCRLSDALRRLSISFPADIQRQISQLLILPEYSETSAARSPEESTSEQFPPQIQLTHSSNMLLLTQLLTSLLKFINPFSRDLPAVVFLHIYNCKLFFCYAIHYLKQSKVCDASVTKSIKPTASKTNPKEDLKVERAAEAVSLAMSLFHKLIDGSATLEDVVVNDAIDLTGSDSAQASIECELTILKEFVSHGFSPNCAVFDVSTHGLKGFVELQTIITNISVVGGVLKQFGLHNCQRSEPYALLKDTAEQMKNIGSMTLVQVKELLAGVKQILHLKGNTDLSCFKLFQAVKRNAPFYRFAERMGFTGPNGRESFLSQYRMVLAHLQHEQYNQAILHHLYGSYKYISPFFDKEIEFEQLIEEIVNLPDINMGVKYLEEVAANIVMIKVWFETVEGETMENVEKTLNAVLYTGEGVFSAANQVHFILEYDPKFSLENDSDISESLCISLEDKVAEPCQQSTGQKREWSIKDMNDFSVKLGFVQCEIQQKEDESVEVFKVDHERVRCLLRTYEELKFLGHPEYQLFVKKFKSSILDNTLEKEVMFANNKLHQWRSETDKCRRECAELAFFSNEKVMRILRILQSSEPSSVELVKEIAFLYNSNQETNRMLTQAVQGVLHHLPVKVSSENSLLNLPVKVVGNFLHSIFANEFLPPAICLYAVIPLHNNVPTAPHVNKFTLHAVHNSTPLQILQLILTVFDGVPNSFQIFQCTSNTTEQQLDIFFDRAFHWNDLWYLLLGVNYLHNELQEMLVKKCCDWKMKPTCAIHFVEFSQSVLRLIPSVSIYEHRFSQSVLRLIPSVSIYEHRDCARLNCNIDVCLNNSPGVRPVYNRFQLVYGHAGNGKSHYIKRELRLYFQDRSVIVTLNESFNQLHLIKHLQETLNNDGLVALYLNFTFIQPAKSEGEREHEQYQLLSDKINWFFINLLIFGYVEDVSTGESFRTPCESQWCVYVEVPSLDVEDPHKSIEKFIECYPVFDVLGKEKLIGSDIPYECDNQVQLVCKYLKAMKTNNLDQELTRNIKEVRIGAMKKLSNDECCALLNEYMPPHVRLRKISQKLYIRYMHRRCHFLEESPYLKYNQGYAPGVAVKDEITGKMVQKEKHYKDASKLRSVLFSTMRREVAYFSDQCIGTHEKGRQYHQLVYDFQNGEGNFSLLSTFTETSDHSDELNIQTFRELGFELPSRMQLRKSKELLHKILARGLGVPYNPKKGHIDLLDDMQYVMTLDFAVKMLTIHERRLCGIPVVIKGETGVGKTFLLETLSALWNCALLRLLDHERDGLKDNLERDLSNYLFQSTATSDGEDVTEAFKSISGEQKITLATISFILGKKSAIKNGKFLFEKYLDNLLSLKTNPIFSILELPAQTRESKYNTFSQLFSTAETLFSRKGVKETISVASHLLYAVLYGEMPRTFYKLSVHSALSPEDIKDFFEPIIEQAMHILDTFKLINSTMQSSDAFNQYSHPVITVFLDEINTSSCLGVLKEIVVDKTLDGKELPPNIFIVAACNPYRGDSLVSLEISTQERKPTTTDNSSEIDDENWFRGSYYVRPLSPTLDLLMWDYKALDPSREREFVHSKLSMSLNDEDSSDLTEPIVKSQTLIRKYAFDSLISSGMKEDEANDRSSSTVSQRDIQRAFNFYQWLSRLFASVNRYQGEPPLKRKLRALYVALAIVYYFRLDRKCRKNYAQEMDECTVMGIDDKKPVIFSEALRDELDWLVSETILPNGVAQTEALKENLYATVVCTMTHTPLIIVGAPGSSKTLSFKITVSNLQGLESANETFRNEAAFHALEPTFYQCSRRSTSTEIEGVFKRAIASQKFYLANRQNCYSVVMMDEAGLPEESHESLKVLHVHLDNQEVSFVGISNHVLDAAKSNRAVSLFRPETSEEDVRELASVCLKGQPGLINGICRAYMIKMKSQDFRKFYGLRDFIHFFTYLQRRKRNNDEVATPQMIMQAIERNFNGSDQFKSICECFLEEMGHSHQRVKQRSVLTILKHSLVDKPKDLSAENEVRYKLIIDSSEDESVIRFLFTFGVLQREKTRMYICSKFPGDGETQKINTIAAIRHSALQGHTVILSQTDEIHESFYDLFNQRFTCIHHHQDGKQYYTNIAIGPHVKPSRVDPHFQCVVVIKQSELHCTPAPFLNRFEKYALNHESLLEDILDSYPRRLRDLVCIARDKVKCFLELFDSNGLYGQNHFTLDSLLLTIMPPYDPAATVEAPVDHCDLTGTERLLSCLMSALRMRTGVSTCMVSDNLAADAKHVSNNVKRDPEFSASLDGLDEDSIPGTVDKAIDALLNEDDEVTVSRTICTVIAFLQQWLVSYLCERLMQLMTPETLIANHKNIPRHYIEVYLNHQHHFNLRELIGDYQNAQLQRRSSVPNKLLCFSRSSPLIHTSFQSQSSSGDEANILSPKIEQLVFSYSISATEGSFKNRLSVLKITATSTQTTVFRRLQSFVQSETHEVMLIVINMQYSTVEIVNHLRIMIEEAEAQFHSSEELNKLFVVLLHFPPEMFFNHCYPSLFLSGWDHYYLDTIAPPEEKGVIDICQWFSHCCGAVNRKNPAEFLDKPLQELMEEAIPALAAQFSMAEIMASDQLVVGNKVDMLKNVFQTKLGEIVRERFISYWLTSVITEVSEQAANYPHMYESTLSITDAILTIVKSSFYDFLFYVLSILRKECVLGPLSRYQQDQENQKLIQLSFDLFRSYPLPKTLSNLKAASISEIHTVHVEDTGYLQRCRYPFFNFISSLLENLLDQCKKEVNLMQKNDTDSDEQVTEEGIRKKLCDIAEEKLASATEIQDIKSLNVALQAMEESDELWTRYSEALMVSKFSLRKDSSQSIKVLSDKFIGFQALEIRRRVIELHACIRYCGLDSKLLAVLRFLDSMHERSKKLSKTLDKTGIVQYFHGENSLSSLMIDSLYTSVYDACYERADTSRCSSILGEMSSYYHAMILVPAMQELFSAVPDNERERLNVLHVTFLVYNSGLSKTTTAIAVNLFRLLHNRITSQDDCYKLSLKDVVESTVQVNSPNSTVVEAINSPDFGIHYILKGLFEHFLPTQSDSEDLRWLFEIANNPSVMQIPYSSPTARCIRQCIFVILTERKYDQSCREQTILQGMLLDQKSLEVQALGDYLAGCLEDPSNEYEYVPVHYLRCSLLQPKKDFAVQPLAHIYSSLMLETLRRMPNISLTRILRLHGSITRDITDQSSKEAFLQKIKEQTIIQYLIEILAKVMVTRSDIYQELAEVLNRINLILVNTTTNGEAQLGCHGLMLGLQLLKAHGSSTAFYEAMTTNFNDLCGDFECLHPLNTKLLQSKQETDTAAAERQRIFPFGMMNGADSFEQRLYAEISKMLTDLYRSPTRMRTTLLRIVDRCYSGAEEVEFGRKKRNKFNMLLWLCVYQEFYCKKIRRKPAFVQVLKENLTQYMEQEYLQLILMFAGFNHSPQPLDATRTEPLSILDLYHPQWRDQYSDLGDTIAYLVATLLGSCDYPCHLHKHAFAPKQLLGTFIPGRMRYDNPVGSGIFYNECVHLETTGFLPGIHRLASKSTCTMSLHCYYFTHWANYAALCISHLVNPHAADSLFLNNFNVHRHCFTSMLDMWNMMGQYLHLTAEHRFDLINSCFGKVYDYEFNTYDMKYVKQLNLYEHEWNKVFEIGWKSSIKTDLRRPLLSYSTEIDRMFCQVDEVFPVHANPTDFFLQLFSSSFLDEKDGSLYILYQFILHRPKLNAGGMLLPELVQFYRWVHNELNYTVTFDDAKHKNVTVEEMLKLYLERHYHGEEREIIFGMFQAVADKYQVYRDAVGQSIPQLTADTPLIDILSTLNGKDILYCTIEQIVNSFNNFLEGMKCSTVVAQRYYAQMNDTKKQILTEISEVDCCFGTAVRLDDLNELMPLISECCNPVTFTDRDNPLASVDPTILPCCVPQLFDFVELQEDIIRSYVAGKCRLQSPRKIQMSFNFKEQSKPQNLPGNILEGAVFQMASLHRLPEVFQADLDEEICKRTEMECHSMAYYTLLEVTIGLRNAASYLLKECGTAMNCQQQTLSEFITTVAPGTKDILNHIGVQTKRVCGLTKSQCNYLQNIKLVHLYKTLQLLVEWLELGMYDFCSLSFAMKVHLTEESKHVLHQVLMGSHGQGVGMPLESMQELKCFQTLLVRSESLLRNAVDTNLTKPLKDILSLSGTNKLVKKCLTDDVLVCHYVHLRKELRKLYIKLQTAVGKEVVDEHAISKRWDDWTTDIWKTLGYDRHDSPDSSMNVPLDPGVTYYPHENKWGLQMDSLETDLHSLAESKMQTQQLEELNESTLSENVHDVVQSEVPVAQNQVAAHVSEQINEEQIKELAKNDNLVEYLKTIGMEEVAENVIENEVTGDIAIGDLGEDIMAEQGMSAVNFLRFRVLYRRHLLHQISELGKKCPVERVIEFFEQYSVLRKHAKLIKEIGIDGEMLLEASKSEAASLELRRLLTATGWAMIQRDFRGFTEGL